jgi:hypothetical protein
VNGIIVFLVIIAAYAIFEGGCYLLLNVTWFAGCRLFGRIAFVTALIAGAVAASVYSMLAFFQVVPFGQMMQLRIGLIGLVFGLPCGLMVAYYFKRHRHAYHRADENESSSTRGN